MLTIGVLINTAAILLGVIARLFTSKEIPPKTQTTVNTLLAALLCWTAGRLIWIEAVPGIIPLLKGCVLAWVCLALSTFLLRRSPLLRHISAQNQSVRQLYCNLAAGSGKTSRWDLSLRIGICFFTLTPLTFIACAAMGAYGEFRPFIVKSILDFMGIFVFARTLKFPALAVIMPMTVLQVLLLYLFNLGSTLGNGVASGSPALGLCTAFLCLHTTLVIMGWNKAGPLISYVPALFLALIIELLR